MRRVVLYAAIGLVAAVVAVGIVFGFQANFTRATHRRFTTNIAGLSIVSTLVKPVSASEAPPANVIAEALAAPNTLDHDGLTGLTVSKAVFARGVTAVGATGGRPAFSSTLPMSLWVITVHAPAQSGWKYVNGTVIVNAATGAIVGTSVLESN